MQSFRCTFDDEASVTHLFTLTFDGNDASLTFSSELSQVGVRATDYVIKIFLECTLKSDNIRPERLKPNHAGEKDGCGCIIV